MKKWLKIFIVYFPVFLVSGQVLANLLYFIDRPLYMATGFYLNLFLGTNVLFAVFLLAFTYLFRFCAVSRYAAIAECLFAFFYLVIQQDDVYNILFQITVGVLAIVATFWHYIKKFPLCHFSLAIRFYKNVLSELSCRKGLDKWDQEIKHIIHAANSDQRRL